MSASDLAPFVAAVIEDGIVADMKNKIEDLKHKIEDLESTVQDRDNARLRVQMTRRGGNRIYGEHTLKMAIGIDPDLCILDFDLPEKIVDGNILKCVCPFDEESITQLEIRVGGTVLLKQFFMVDDQYQWYYNGVYTPDMNDSVGPSLYFEIVAVTGNKSPISKIYVRIGLAASSSASIVTFLSLVDSFPTYNMDGRIIQPEQVLHHFDTLINVNGERGGGTKLTLTFENIIFCKDSISGCISLMDKLGIRLTNY